MSAGDTKGMLDFLKPYLPGNAPMLDRAVYWMRRDQREAFFDALHALGVPVSPGMLSGLIRGHAAMRNVAAARVAYRKWTAQGVPTTLNVWKALASIHVHQPNPQAGLCKRMHAAQCCQACLPEVASAGPACHCQHLNVQTTTSVSHLVDELPISCMPHNNAGKT